MIQVLMVNEEKIEKKNKHSFLIAFGVIFLILIISTIINNLNTNIQNYTANTILENKTFIVQKGYLHYECWDSLKNLSINTAVDSTKPVDIYFTPSEQDVKFLINKSEFMNYPSCHSPQVLSDNINCVIDGKGCLVISNLNGLEDSQVNLKISTN